MFVRYKQACVFGVTESRRIRGTELYRQPKNSVMYDGAEKWMYSGHYRSLILLCLNLYRSFNSFRRLLTSRESAIRGLSVSEPEPSISDTKPKSKRVTVLLSTHSRPIKGLEIALSL